MSEEALIYFEIDRHSDESVIKDIAQSLDSILKEVALVVDDFKEMSALGQGIIKDVKATKLQKPAVKKEIVAFIEWLIDGHFMFLGYEKLAVEYQGDEAQVSRVDDQTFGLFKQRDSRGCIDLQREISRVDSKEKLLEYHVTFSKSSLRARVHRFGLSRLCQR